MKTPSTSPVATVFASLSLGLTLLADPAAAQSGTATGGTVTGGSVTGGTTTGGTVTGGSVQGGSVTRGSVTGGTVTGGTVTGGSVTGGTVTAGTATAGSVTQGTVGAGTASVTLGSREVRASAKGSVSIQPDGDKAVVKIDGRTLIVDKDKLLLDGKEQGKLPSGASKIEIEAADGAVKVRADGKEVLNTKAAKAE